MVEGGEMGIQLGNVLRGKVWGQGGLALDKHVLVGVELACCLTVT